MESLGINFSFLLVQLILGFGWIGFSIFSLFSLRSRNLRGMTLAVWVLAICAIPVLGALAYWIVRPSGEYK
jgi:hypothetical protein